jgi:hypothetical protein
MVNYPMESLFLLVFNTSQHLPHTSNEVWTFILEIYIVSVLCQLTKDS